MNKTHHVRFDYNPRLRALSSAGERCLHTAEVTGSIPVAPTPGRLVDLIRSLLFLVLISACGGFTPPQEGDLLTVYYELSVARLLDGLEIAPEHRSGNQRDLFPHWSDEDGDGCDTRREVLIRDARSDLLFSDFDNCRIGSGVWYSPYDDVWWEGSPAGLHIDHLVPLQEAWDSGAHAWDASRRQTYANDLSGLVIATVAANKEKGGDDPHRWMPANPNHHCPYLAGWIAVKARWSLSVDPQEAQFLRHQLQTRCQNLTINLASSSSFT